MTALVLVVLACLALLDGAFSGFRASLGRTGLVDHRAEDRRGLRRGVAVVVMLSVPAMLALIVDLAAGGQELASYRDAGLDFLMIVGPYAAIVLLALAVYGLLRWELRYLASAVILGPFTLVRPYIVVAAAVVALVRAGSAGIAVTGALAAAAVLLVEPMCGRVAARELSSQSTHPARRDPWTSPS